MFFLRQRHVVCLLYGGGSYLGESVMGGSTVYHIVGKFGEIFNLAIWRNYQI